MSDMNGLTPRQVDLLRTIKDYQMAHDGVSPTYQEIADAMDVSKVTVSEHLRTLSSRCVLQFEPRKNRSIKLLIDVEPSDALRDRIEHAVAKITIDTDLGPRTLSMAGVAGQVADRVLDVLGGAR